MATNPILNRFPILPPIAIHSYERYLPTAFDESMSILQKINKVINHLNEIGDTSNELVTKWNELMEWIVGNGLTDVVSAEIDKRIADGTFDELIYRIVGDLTTLETEDKTTMVVAINEVLAIALLNDNEIGEITTLSTIDKSNLVNAINELKASVDINLQGPISIVESTGYGTVSGFKVTQQPILAMAVEVGNATIPNIVHLPSGIRYVVESVSLPVVPSHSTLNRIDIVYVDDLGVSSYLQGVAAINPVAPPTPIGSVLLAEIRVVATDTTVNDVDITDRRNIKSLNNLLTNNKTNFVESINEIITSLNDVINNAVGNVANLPTDDKTTIVNAIIEIVNESATKVEVGDKNLLLTSDKTTIVNSINEVVNESATKVEVGDKNLLLTSDKTTIVNSINEVVTESATKIELENVVLTIGNNVNLSTTDKTTIVNAVNEVLTKLGDKNILSTTDKTTVVNAVNEVLSKLGDKSNLITTDKTTIVSAINEVLSKLGDKNNLISVDKTSIVNAINEVITNLNAVDTQINESIVEALDDFNQQIKETSPLPLWLNVSIKDALHNYDKYIRQFGVNVGQPPFNAKGDGITDDTKAIQDAIDYAKINKLPVLALAPNYLITTLLIPSYMHFIGGGIENTLFRTKSNLDSAFVIANGARRVIIRDLDIVAGGVAGQFGADNSGIRLDLANGGAEHHFSNMNIVGFKYGLRFRDVFWNSTVSDVRISLCDYSMFNNDSSVGSNINNLFERCYSNEPKTAGFRFVGLSNTKFDTCNFGGRYQAGDVESYYGTFGAGCRGVSFDTCNFESIKIITGSYGILVASNAKVSFKNTNFQTNVGTGALKGHEISVDSNAQVTIENCTQINATNMGHVRLGGNAKLFQLDSSFNQIEHATGANALSKAYSSATPRQSISAPIKLSAPKSNQCILLPKETGRITRISFIYTEATSIDVGVKIKVHEPVFAYVYCDETTKPNKAAFSTEVDIPLGRTVLSADRPIIVECTGGKTGVGEVAVVIEYILDY